MTISSLRGKETLLIWSNFSLSYSVLTLSQMANFRLSKMNEFADDNLRYYENCRKFLKRVKNTVGKGEIACYEQFLLFPQCFQKTCTADT